MLMSSCVFERRRRHVQRMATKMSERHRARIHSQLILIPPSNPTPRETSWQAVKYSTPVSVQRALPQWTSSSGVLAMLHASLGATSTQHGRISFDMTVSWATILKRVQNKKLSVRSWIGGRLPPYVISFVCLQHCLNPCVNRI